MSEYIGITIGPIIKTLSLTSSPAGMWGASYLFSYIAKSLCQEFILNGIPKENIITPYLKLDDKGKILNMKPGVGLFHDRIVFETNENIDIEAVKKTIDSIKADVGKKIYDDLENGGLFDNENKSKDEKRTEVISYIDGYLQIYGIQENIKEDENPLLILSKKLDALELQQAFVQEESQNYILMLFDNRMKEETDPEGYKTKNNIIRNSFLVKDFGSKFEDWPLSKDNQRNVRNLQDIATVGRDENKMKKESYYAIVQADGDNMGKILANLKAPEEKKEKKIAQSIYEFSKQCVNYCSKSVDTITDYGGVTIYAGGDDLLFIAPVEGKNGTLFNLLKKLEKDFEKEFGHYKDDKPSLSFGVAIHYYKFPLYEAFQNSMRLLFGVAKQTVNKNTTAINVQKHSGQNFGLVIEETKKAFDPETETDYGKLITLFETHWNKESIPENSESEKTTDDEIKKKNEFLRSVAMKIYDFRELFLLGMESENNEALENLFDNVFNSAAHGKKEVENGQIVYTESREYIEKVKELLIAIKENDGKLKSLDDGELSEMEANVRLHEKQLEEERRKLRALQSLKTIDASLKMLKFNTEN